MSDQLEISDGKGRQRRIAVGQETFVLGSGPAVDLRLTVPGVEPEHLRFVRTDVAVRVEPVRAGATVQVNGEALLCKELGAGDVVEVAG
ncbi:MAG: FHA domain-containing protein, partial [Planctomycetota bacterium]